MKQKGITIPTCDTFKTMYSHYVRRTLAPRPGLKAGLRSEPRQSYFYENFTIPNICLKHLVPEKKAYKYNYFYDLPTSQ